MRIAKDMCCRSTGFTLIELLVALTISSIIMLTVVTAFWLGLRVWHRNEDGRPAEEQAHRIVQVLRSELAGAYLPSPAEGAGPAFEHKNPNELSFYTSSPSYYRDLPCGRCVHVTYEFGAKDGKLKRTEQLVATDRPIADPVDEVIAEGLTSLEFHCDTDDGKLGEDSSSAQLPRYVRLDIRWLARSVTAQLPITTQDTLLADAQTQ